MKERKEVVLGNAPGLIRPAADSSPLRPAGGAKAIGVSVVHKNKAARHSLQVLIDGSEGFRCVGIHSRLDKVLPLASVEQLDVVLLDLELPADREVEELRELRARSPRTESLVLLPLPEPRLVTELLEAGASGCLVKPVAPANLLEALAHVHRSGVVLCSEVARLLIEMLRSRGASRCCLKELTRRETEMLRYLAQGHHSKEIARLCSISLQTVNTHLAHIYRKLKVRSRAAAVSKLLAT